MTRRPEKLNALYLQDIWRAVEKARELRARNIPSQEHALIVMWEAFQRLKELGWQEIIYCPKDGSTFESISLGSTGIHDTIYLGDWPNGSWEVIEAGDLWPASPILWRPKPTETD